jgi:PAS domain S-box-containing protein
MKSSYIAKAVFTVWLSVIASIYLKKIDTTTPGEGKGALDIVLAFVGNYGNFESLRQNLKEWEGRYRMVIENAADLIILMDSGGRILDANPAALKTLGFERIEEISGKNAGDFFLNEQEGRSTVEKYFEEYNDSNRPFDIKAKTRYSAIVELQAVMNTIAAEPETMTILVARDVTTQNRLNREKEELKEELVHSQRLESIGKLAGGVAHDFNNYLHAIQGNLDILLLMHDIKDEKTLKHLEKINNITDNASKLTQQLLGFARKGKYRIDNIDMAKLVPETLALFSSSALDTEKTELICELRKTPCRIRGDAVQLKQILLNILINARDAVEDKKNAKKIISIVLAEAEDFKDIFELSRKNPDFSRKNFFCLAISDNGCGMDKETLSRIFEPFFTTKPTGKGTGMGLAMAYGAVTNHNGWIAVDSEVGKGTSFHIFLPLHETE